MLTQSVSLDIFYFEQNLVEIKLLPIWPVERAKIPREIKRERERKRNKKNEIGRKNKRVRVESERERECR